MWLLVTYFLHTMGELCLSPVGLSAMTKLAPASVTGLMMGVWFLSLSVGNYLGGRMAALYESLAAPNVVRRGWCVRDCGRDCARHVRQADGPPDGRRPMNVDVIQPALKDEALDGWLFFDHHRRDPLAYRILGLTDDLQPTRRWYYFIPRCR